MEQAQLWKLIEKHLPDLRRSAGYVYRTMLEKTRAGSIFSAEDILHEAVVKLARNPSLLHYNLDEEARGLQKLFFITMKCVVYDLVRLNDTKKCVSMQTERTFGETDQDVFSPYGNTGSASTEQNADAQMEKREQIENLYLCLDALSKTNPEDAISLLYSLDIEEPHSVEGHNYKAMAQELGVTETNYKQRRFTGIKRLRTRYNHLLD